MESIPIVVADIDDDDAAATMEVLRRRWPGQGPKVEALEEEGATLTKRQHAVACHSGTAALHLTLLSLGVGSNDLVMTPAFSFVASANVVEYCGAKPLFVDIDLATYNIDPAALAGHCKQQQDKIAAVMVVHQFGLCADMASIESIATQFDFDVVEDAACALGSKLHGQEAGSFGEVACFSFHPRKVVTAGEGGMLVTDRAEVAQRCRLLRSHGLEAGGEMRELGFNYRMTDLQAAMVLSQLKRLPALLAKRQHHAAFYTERLQQVEELILPQAMQGSQPNYQSYVVRLQPEWLDATKMSSIERVKRKRDAMITACHEQGVMVRPAAYSLPALQYYQQKYALSPMSFPNSLLAANSTVALPIYPGLQEQELERVVSTVTEAARFEELP